MRDTIKCDNRKQTVGCFDCADTTCPLAYYYDQPKCKYRKTVRNYKDRRTPKMSKGKKKSGGEK